MGPKSDFIWMNGKLVRFQDATVHFMTPGLHYGIGAFEGIRCYAAANGPAIFRLHDHMQRLVDVRDKMNDELQCFSSLIAAS